MYCSNAWFKIGNKKIESLRRMISLKIDVFILNSKLIYNLPLTRSEFACKFIGGTFILSNDSQSYIDNPTTQPRNQYSTTKKINMELNTKVTIKTRLKAEDKSSPVVILFQLLKK